MQIFELDTLVRFFNSSFFSSTMSSALGAVGGAQAIKMIGKINQRYKDVSIINADLILLSNAIGKSIGLKKLILPIYQETLILKKDDSKNDIDSNHDAIFTIIKPKFSNFEKVFSFVYEHATVHYLCVVMCGKLIESIEELSNIVIERNEVLAEIYKDNPNMLEKLYALNEVLYLKLENSLFYNYYAFKEFRNLALRVIPKRLHKKIVMLDIDEKDKKLIPSYKFIKGFYEQDPGYD